MSDARMAAIAAAITAYLQTEVGIQQSTVRFSDRPGINPWAMFGRLDLMCSRDVLVAGGKRGGSGGASSFKASTIRRSSSS